jgi:acetyl-CoA acetyltransferase
LRRRRHRPATGGRLASYSNDRNDPSRLAAALGLPELRFSNMQWGSGGGSATMGNAAAAIAAGYADCVVVFRALAQGPVPALRLSTARRHGVGRCRADLSIGLAAQLRGLAAQLRR